VVVPFCSDRDSAYLRVTGESTFGNGGSRLWLARPEAPETALSEVRRVVAGPFAVTFTMPVDKGPYRLITAPEPDAGPTKAGQLRRGLRLKSVEGYPERTFHRDITPAPAALHLKGRTMATDGPTALWVAAPSAPEVPLTGRVEVGPGTFEIMLRLPSQPGDYVLVPSRYQVPGRDPSGTMDFRRLSINLDSYETVPVTATGSLDGLLAIPATAVDRQETGAYQRRFVVRHEVWGAGNGRFVRPVTVELPLAYNPFFELTQEGQVLAAQPNEAGRAVIATRTLAAPIEAQFNLPLLCWIGGVAGLVLLAFLPWLGRRLSPREAGQVAGAMEFQEAPGSGGTSP